MIRNVDAYKLSLVRIVLRLRFALECILAGGNFIYLIYAWVSQIYAINFREVGEREKE